MITFIRDECRRIVAWTWSDNPVDILDCYSNIIFRYGANIEVGCTWSAETYTTVEPHDMIYKWTLQHGWMVVIMKDNEIIHSWKYPDVVAAYSAGDQFITAHPDGHYNYHVKRHDTITKEDI